MDSNSGILNADANSVLYPRCFLFFSIVATKANASLLQHLCSYSPLCDAVFTEIR